MCGYAVLLPQAVQGCCAVLLAPAAGALRLVVAPVAALLVVPHTCYSVALHVSVCEQQERDLVPYVIGVPGLQLVCVSRHSLHAPPC